MINRIKTWWRDQHRTSWLTCYNCGHDLNGDNDSFIREANDQWYYRCANCTATSQFSLHGPIPTRVVSI